MKCCISWRYMYSGGLERNATRPFCTHSGGRCRQTGDSLREPVSGDFQAQVILRPVKLLALEKLLREEDWKVRQRKADLARQFSFGDAAAS